MKKSVFVGSSAAIATPFKGGTVDYDALLNMINVQKLAGTAAITVCGTTGEASTMTDEEKFNVIRFTKEHSDNMPVIAGTGTNSTAKTLENSKLAEEAGADALLLVTPYYNKTTQAGLADHFTYVADRVSKPVILYNVPSRTALNIEPDTYALLSQHENINGAKEASGNIPKFIESRAKCPENFSFWSGNDDVIVPMMALGAKGVISVAANIVPEVISQIAKLCLEGSFTEASRLQIQYSELISALFSEVNPIPVKAALGMLGMCENELRRPLVPMTATGEEKLRQAMEKVKVLK